MKSILLFGLVTYGLSIALGLLVGFTGGHESEFVSLALAAMFFPAVAVLVLRYAKGEKIATMGWRRFPLKYLPIALLLIPVAMHIPMLSLTYLLVGGFSWESWLVADADGLYHASSGVITGLDVVGRLLVNAGVGIVVMMFFVFFEEIGWRAWLLPRLADIYSVKRAIVAGALIWAFWHTPFALSGIHHIEGMSIWQVAAIMPIGQIGAGLIIGWLWFKTESIWMVVFAHASLNNWGQYAFKFMTDIGGHDAVLLLSGNTTLLVIGVLLVFKMPAEPQLAQSAATE